MDPKDRAKYEARARLLKALAHPTRLKLVDELAAHDNLCVCDLTEAIGSDISTVSRHLTQLKNAGIVASEKHGKYGFPQGVITLMWIVSQMIKGGVPLRFKISVALSGLRGLLFNYRRLIVRPETAKVED